MTAVPAISRDLSPSRRAKAAGLGLLAAVLTIASAGAKDIRISECPPEVRDVILAHIGEGKLDEIKRIQVSDRILYLVEIDLRGFRERKLHISGNGKLLKSVEEIRQQDLPPAVKSALAATLGARHRVDEVDKVVVDGKTHYRVEIDRPQAADLIVTFEEDGTIASGK